MLAKLSMYSTCIRDFLCRYISKYATWIYKTFPWNTHFKKSMLYNGNSYLCSIRIYFFTHCNVELKICLMRQNTLDMQPPSR